MQWVKDHSAEARQIAKNCQKLTLRNHTYYNRVFEMLHTTGLLAHGQAAFARLIAKINTATSK